MIFEKIYDMENLQAAWSRVRANRPGPGIDRVRWEDFEANLSHNLQMLQKQICDEAYKPLPVSVFKEPKPTGKTRTIGISTIRDKVVQQAVLLALGPHFEKSFLPCCYAYRHGMSALSAVRSAGRCIAQGKLWILQMDVEKYFDSMDHVILLSLIDEVVDEKPLLRLISRLLKAKIFKEMGLFDNLVGSQQGSGLSPLLSNIYLYPLDKELWARYKECYLRYSDDIAILADEREKVEEARGLVEQGLGRLKLAVNQGKTSISHVSAGIVYLGFFMDANGKGPSRKSIEGLESKLTEYHKLRKTDDAAAKLAEVKTAIRGWYNYYKTLKPIRPANIVSLIALVELAKELGEASLARDLLKNNKSFTHNHPDICFQMGEIYAGFGMRHQAMREYARALELEPAMEAAKEKVRKLQEGEENIHQAIEKIQLLLHHNPHYREGYQKLAELYVQLGLYGFAEKAHRKALEIDDETEPKDPSQAPAAENATSTAADPVKPPPEDGFDYRSVDLDTFVEVFTGRRDAHARQWVDERGRWGFARVERPLKTRDAYAHLKGDVTLAVYPVTARDTVSFIVFDIDTAKRVILELGGEMLDELRNKAHQDISRIKKTCDRLGLALYLEDSGYKGRHGWLFFSEELPATEAIQAGREIMRISGGPSDGMIWELFPMGKSERNRSLIKLPLGINRKNNRRCLFLHSDNHPIVDQSLLLKAIKRNHPSAIRQLLDKKAEGGGTEGGSLFPGEQGRMALSSGIEKMLTRCKVINHLISKARDTNYLNHYERICLLYTLSFAGEEGCRLLHKVISYCINYDHDYTQRQIDRRKESPMSCAKIMENFPELAETLGCGCKFKLPPRSYPSPVLYLLESEIEGACAGAPGGGAATCKPGDRYPEAEKLDTPGPQDPVKPQEQDTSTIQDGAEEQKPDEAPGEQVETLDFERLFSDEGLPAQAEGEAENEQVAPPSAGAGEAVDGPAREPAQGYREWNNEDRMLVAEEEETGEKEEDKPEIPSEKPEHGAPDGSALIHRAAEAAVDTYVDIDAWELVLEYLKLRHSEEKLRTELEAVSSRLDALFDCHASDVLQTRMGTIRRIRKSGGRSSWILSTAD